MKVSVVIGSSYGDEGKGNTTNFLCGKDTLNVRFNGGSQAGHTVVDGDRRHVFSHFGAGTFRGARTFLGDDFVTCPMSFRKEWEKLDGKIQKPYISPNCLVTTPFDIMINQALEKKRGVYRHGSCGSGFGETIERHQDTSLQFMDLRDHSRLEQIVRNIVTHWVPKRLDELELNTPEYIFDEKLLYRYLEDCRFMFEHSIYMEWRRLAPYWNGDIVFEGAQGLKLDMDTGVFPHVTRSNTGMVNVLPMLKCLMPSNVDVHYVTRPYVTRHGFGPLAHEREMAPYGIIDETNIRNKFQGHLRFADINLNILKNDIDRDFKQSQNMDINFNKKIVVTCCDQIENFVNYYMRYELRVKGLYVFLRDLRNMVEPTEIWFSIGQNKNDFQKLH